MSQFDLAAPINHNPKVHSEGYRVLKKLGGGSYAMVYLTELYNETDREKPVERLACKIIDIRFVPDEFVDKFLPRELKILRQLRHPHIIHIHSIYKKNSRYAERGDLLDYILRRGPIPEGQSRIWTKQVALALQYMHELEIAHRDLKCENILITSNFNVKLADFGFSRCVVNNKGLRMLSETYCGSTAYSAPEILKGIPYNPKVSDIWSLGVLIYVMLNKAMPFEETNVKKLYERQIKKNWKFKAKVESVLSDQVKNLLENILEPNVHKRYTISEVVTSGWMFMDHRTLHMTEMETLALVKAKEERRKMDEEIFSAKNDRKKK
ncbi:hypothetical protein RUM43_007535 [Polyplax serrata]|uniref:Protein kinase domain-containing protein n=1 Tax=Polyplax serrata TaxID=468196 RepID=A0AAN8PME6_POLSC